MPWYYAGLDAKPVGPITLEELQARRANGAISPETYVIEYVGQQGEPRAWKRYREMFPTSPSLPPVSMPPPPPVLPPPPPLQPHPLFPSAAPSPAHPAGLPSAGPHSHLYPANRTNPWCTWGFGLSLASLILLLPSCGLTALVAIPALGVSLVGFFQVQHDREQTGRNLALSGLFLSGATLILTAIILVVAVPAILKGRGQITTTEQSTNDSE